MDKNRAIENAKKAAAQYCKRNNLSEQKLATQSCLYFGEFVGFLQEMPYSGTGLREDESSQPRPTLIYYINSGTIEATDYTSEYLS